MAGKPQYTDAEILWFVKQVFEYKIKNEDRVCAGFEERFGRVLKAHQYKYLKGKYGKDADYKMSWEHSCPASTGNASLVRPAISQEAQLPILPIGQDYATMSSQIMEGYGNVGQGLNGGSSAMTEANHYTTAQHPTANNTPRQTTEAPVPVPWQAGPSGNSTMYTASRRPRSARRHQAARAAAYQQAQAAVHADEQIERQLQNRQQVQGMQQQMFQWQRMQGMSGPQYPPNQTPMFWPPANVSPSIQQAHFSHDMHQAPGYAPQEIFAGGQPNWTMNPYSVHQPPVADYTQQATYMGNHGQALSTQPWIETQENHLQGRQSPAPVAYMGNHGQELETGPWIGTQEPHLQEMEYPTPAAPEVVFSAPEQASSEVAPQLGAPDLATVRETEENQQETGQGMQSPYERNGEPYPSPALSHAQSQQGMPLPHEESQQSEPLLHGESQQSEPLLHGESQQSMPLSEEGQAASQNLQKPTPVNAVSPFSYEVIKILHLQKLCRGSNSDAIGIENAEEQDGEVADFNFEDFLNLENVP